MGHPEIISHFKYYHLEKSCNSYNILRFLPQFASHHPPGRCRERSREVLSNSLAALGSSSPAVGEMLLELCVTELEDAATDTERIKSVPQPLVQGWAH